MVESNARVVRVEGKVAYVTAERDPGCGSCSSEGGACGVTAMGKIFGGKPRQFRALNTLEAQVGERVVIGVEDGALLKGALAVYLMPLILVFSGALAAASLVSDAGLRDSYSAMGAGAGLLLGIVWLKYFSVSRESNQHYQPVILRRVDEGARVFNLVREI